MALNVEVEAERWSGLKNQADQILGQQQEYYSSAKQPLRGGQTSEMAAAKHLKEGSQHHKGKKAPRALQGWESNFQQLPLRGSLAMNRLETRRQDKHWSNLDLNGPSVASMYGDKSGGLSTVMDGMKIGKAYKKLMPEQDKPPSTAVMHQEAYNQLMDMNADDTGKGGKNFERTSPESTELERTTELKGEVKGEVVDDDKARLEAISRKELELRNAKLRVERVEKEIKVSKLEREISQENRQIAKNTRDIAAVEQKITDEIAAEEPSRDLEKQQLQPVQQKPQLQRPAQSQKPAHVNQKQQQVDPAHDRANYPMMQPNPWATMKPHHSLERKQLDGTEGHAPAGLYQERKHAPLRARDRVFGLKRHVHNPLQAQQQNKGGQQAGGRFVYRPQ